MKSEAIEAPKLEIPSVVMWQMQIGCDNLSIASAQASRAIPIPTHLLTIMGQRHQFFAIARVRRPQQPQSKYECVVAVHHQWCYGVGPLLAVSRFVALLQNPTNASIVFAELRALENRAAPSEVRWDAPKSDLTQCPYTAFLFSDAIYTDISDENNPVFDSLPWMHHLLPCAMDSQEGGEIIVLVLAMLVPTLKSCYSY